MTIEVPGISRLTAFRSRPAAWVTASAAHGRSRPGSTERAPAAVDVADAAAEELAGTDGVRSVKNRRLSDHGAAVLEIVVHLERGAARPDVARACDQMAQLISPLARQENLDVRFRFCSGLFHRVLPLAARRGG